MTNLPDKLYRVASVVQLEQLAINQYDIPAYELMQRAGRAVFDLIHTKYSRCKNILVLCGAGNNAGDGYVVARLLRQADYDVSVVSLIDPEKLQNEARQAYLAWCEVGQNYQPDMAYIKKAGIIVDALLGTGLQREVSAEWAKWIDAVNRSGKPVISVDIPSGLYADTGAIAGTAIQAERTVCFIGLKQGMFTAQGKDVCGEIVFDDLALPAELYSALNADAQLIQDIDLQRLPPRKASSHKGCFGHVLIAGGNSGMPGAVILAARAALRAGAGLVTVVTRPQNLQAVCSAVPEAMVKTGNADSIDDLFKQDFLASISHVAVGMGLGQDDWALSLLQHCIQLNKPMVIDADALNLIAAHDTVITSALVLTPHPGEAARLLSRSKPENISAADIQKNRFQAVKQLHALFTDAGSCTVVLKGSGSLIFDGNKLKVCNRGSAAMATPGMGDVLSGIVVALLAQGKSINTGSDSDRVELAVCLHAGAADRVTQEKTRGLLASDVIDALPALLG